MDTFLPRPEPKKPKLCVWCDLNVYNTDKILKCSNNSEVRRTLQDIFCLDESSRNDILLDLYTHAIIFAKLQNFSKEQMSTYFSILKQTHEVCVATPFGNVEECFSFFRELVLTHSVHRPPWSLEIFSPAQIETITTHVINTYFRHYKLYKYAFTPKVRLDLSLRYEGLAPSPVPEEQVQEQPEDQDKTPLDQGDSAVPTPDVDESAKDTTPVEDKKPEENEAFNELENVVRKAVSLKLKEMQSVVERQLEDSDKAITEKIISLEGGKLPASAKGKKSRTPRSSAKGKRK